MEKKTIVEINGLEIKENSVYKVTGKVDYSAPSGMVEMGVSKIPNANIGNLIACRFVQKQGGNPGEGLFDTGLYPESPIFATMPDVRVKEILRNVKKFIVDPYEAKYGKGILSHANTEFWKTYGVYLTMDKFFSTERVEDLLGLYIAMLSYELTPKSDIGNPIFNGADYCIEDKEKAKSIKEERTESIVGAISDFGELLKANKALLINVMKYLNLTGISRKTDDSTLMTAFYEWVNKHNENPSKFSSAVKLAQSEDTRDIISLFQILNEAVKKRTVVKEGGYLTYKGKRLGADVKTAAANLNNKPELEETKLALIEATAP